MVDALIAGGLKLTALQCKKLEGCMRTGLSSGQRGGLGMSATFPHCKGEGLPDYMCRLP